MTDQWYYRMFGQDFGPVSLKELKSLLDLDSLSASDEVRPATSDTWVIASSVTQLGIVSKSAATLKPVLPQVEANKHVGANDWYYQFLDQEMGPLSIDEIVACAEQGQLTADDNVKLGANGKWRRAGSIGRLAAVLPFQSLPEPTPVPDQSTSATPAVTTPAARVAERQSPPSQVGASAPQRETTTRAPTTTAEDLALAQAQSAYNTAEEQAHGMVAWGFAPHVDPTWWGWIGGVEYGPVGFRQVWEWALAGQLRSTDFVRNGMYGQYVPAANVPALMMAANTLAKATVALSECKAKAEAARAASPSPSQSTAPAVAASPPASVAAQPTAAAAPASPAQSAQVSTSKPVPAAVQSPASSTTPPQTVATEPAAESDPPKAAAKVEATEPTRESMPAPRPAASLPASGGGFAASTSSHASAAPRPAYAPPNRPTKASGGSSFPDLLDLLKDPKVAAVAGVALVVLLVFGWQYLPQSSGADIKRYQQLKEILDEVRSKRASKSTDFTALKATAEKVGKEIVDVMKVEASSRYPAKQFLLWAARDEMPRMMKGDLATESASEKNFAARLTDAAKILGVK